MNRFALPLSLLLCSLFLSCSSEENNYRIMTYNIRHGVGMDRILDLERTARVIRSANPDFVILNEVDHATSRSFGVHQADSLGILLEMFSKFGRSIDYDGGQYGNALLSRYPIVDFRILDLSSDSLLEGRSVFLSQIDTGNDTLTIMGTHLGLSPEERQEQVARILEALPPARKLILAGDFNLEPDSETYLELTKHFRDALQLASAHPDMTFPADHPDRRIDYIFVNKNIEVSGAGNMQHPDLAIASDHQPQIINFK